MSRNRLICLALAACLALSAVAVAAPTNTGSKSLTVGDFAVMVASRITPDSTRPVTQPEQAANVLAKSGIRLSSALAAPLTEGEASDLLAQFGITLQVDHPTDPMDRAKALALVDTFSETFAAKTAEQIKTGGSPQGFLASTITLDATLPECQNLSTVKECKACCFALVPTPPKKVCNQSCGNSPKASAMEPTP